MSLNSDLTPKVSESDINSALIHLYGPSVKILNHNSNLATANVQGFSSQIVRITAEISLNGNEKQVSLIGKCLPVVQEQSHRQRDTIERFRRECDYFNHVLPKLQQKFNNLAVVQCYLVREDVIIMEDLNQINYDTLSTGMKDVGNILLKEPHVKLIMEKLAQLHAASLGVDWLKEISFLKEDNLFVIDPSPFSFYTMCIQAFKAAAIVLNDFYPKSTKFIADWLVSPKSFETLIEFAKPTMNQLPNVLAHGDFWINNMMFKIDEKTELPLDVKFVDFQLFRYTHPNRDILHVMYTCLDKTFRDKYEDKMLEMYVTSFNDATDTELELEQFKTEYEDSRVFGCLLATVLRTINLMTDIYPEENETLSQEKFEGMMCGNQYASVPSRFRSESDFTSGFREVLNELVQVAGKYLNSIQK